MSHAPWIIGVPGTILCALYYVLSNPEVLDREAYGLVYSILQPFFQYVDKLFAI